MKLRPSQVTIKSVQSMLLQLNYDAIHMQRLKELEERFHLSVEASSVGMLVVDAEGSIILNNTAAIIINLQLGQARLKGGKDHAELHVRFEDRMRDSLHGPRRCRSRIDTAGPVRRGMGFVYVSIIW